MSCIQSRSLYTRQKARAVKDKGDNKALKKMFVLGMGILTVCLTTTYCVVQWVIHVIQWDESLICY